MDIIAEFKQGCSDGWQMYWSPLSGFFKMAKGIVTMRRTEQVAQ